MNILDNDTTRNKARAQSAAPTPCAPARGRISTHVAATSPAITFARSTAATSRRAVVTAEEIRKKEASTQEAIFLREIAAQLAEFNAMVREAMDAEKA